MTVFEFIASAFFRSAVPNDLLGPWEHSNSRQGQEFALRAPQQSVLQGHRRDLPWEYVQASIMVLET